MKKNEQGVGAVLILLALLVIVLTGAVGWLVYDRQKTNNSTDATTTTTQKKSTDQSTQSTKNETDSKASADMILNNKYFSITLPSQWVESTPNITIGADDKYKYENKDEGKELTILVNPGGFGVYIDSINYQVVDNKIDLDLNSLNKCKNEPPCSVISGRIDLFITSKPDAKINENKYVLFYKDNRSESSESLNLLKTILSSMQFK